MSNDPCRVCARNPLGAMPPYNMVYARFFAGDKALGATWRPADDDIYVID